MFYQSCLFPGLSNFPFIARVRGPVGTKATSSCEIGHGLQTDNTGGLQGVSNGCTVSDLSQTHLGLINYLLLMAFYRATRLLLNYSLTLKDSSLR